MTPRPVLLLNPRICSKKSARLPLSLLSLGAVLEGKRDYQILDGNVEPLFLDRVLAALARTPHALVGVSVMPGPQVAPSIEISSAVRRAFPDVPIAWGGYFPTLYTEAALNAPYVDYVARGPGEETLLELLERLEDAGEGARSLAAEREVAGIAGLSWKRDGAFVHNADRRFRSPDELPALPYTRLGDVAQYLGATFMGERTAVHQAAIGCRYRCGFCGVVSMFNGTTLLPRPRRMADAMTELRDRYGATAMQFFDNNFFDREESSIPVLEELASLRMPYWVYARADTLANFSSATWQLVKASGLKMAYIGAEAASDEVLRKMHKGARVAHTLEVAARCKENGVIPEFSFVLGGPDDPEEEVEKTLSFIKRVKRIHPACEVILYFYTPTPQRDPGAVRKGTILPTQEAYGPSGIALPTTPEEWTEPRWIEFVCHQDAAWLTERTRRRVKDFAQVLACRFPTVQDTRTPAWGRAALKGLASWRYATGVYARPAELEAARRFIPLKEPEREGL
jgi:anaerobic magnesium-protoporphyrin IX monomethyl ester cyclase